MKTINFSWDKTKGASAEITALEKHLNRVMPEFKIIEIHADRSLITFKGIIK